MSKQARSDTSFGRARWACGAFAGREVERRKRLVGGGDEGGWPAIGQAKCMAQPYPSPLLSAQYLPPALLPHSPPSPALPTRSSALLLALHSTTFALSPPGSQGHVVRALTSLLLPEWLSSLRAWHGGGSWVPWCACILSPLWCGYVGYGCAHCSSSVWWRRGMCVSFGLSFVCGG